MDRGDVGRPGSGWSKAVEATAEHGQRRRGDDADGSHARGHAGCTPLARGRRAAREREDHRRRSGWRRRWPISVAGDARRWRCVSATTTASGRAWARVRRSSSTWRASTVRAEQRQQRQTARPAPSSWASSTVGPPPKSVSVIVITTVGRAAAGPRRTGVAGLVEERREPRAGTAARRRPSPRAPAPAPAASCRRVRATTPDSSAAATAATR